MNDNNRSAKIAFVADYLPRQCGIATFTHDLRQAVASPVSGGGMPGAGDQRPPGRL